MNRKSALGLLVVAFIYATVLPAAADEEDEFKGFLCLIELPPNFSQTTTGNEVETFDSELTCEQEGGVLEIELECETKLDRATLNALGIGRRQTKTFNGVPCRIEPSRCVASLEAQLADESKLIIRGKTGKTMLKCELEVTL